MNLFLIAAKGKHKGMPIPIKGDLFLLGSESVCQLRSSRPGVGGQHCALVTREGKVFVRDLDSGQPTVVNGNPLAAGQEWPLHAGDRLEVGSLEFVVQFQEKALSQRNAEEWALKALDDASQSKQTREEEDIYKGGRVSNAADAASFILKNLDAKKGEVKGRMRVFREGDVTVVRLNDEQLVDEAEIDLVKTELSQQAADSSLRVLLDLKNVRRMSSMAIGMVVGLYRQLKARGVSLALCHVNPEVQSVLAVVGVGKLVKVFPNKEAALSARW